MKKAEHLRNLRENATRCLLKPAGPFLACPSNFFFFFKLFTRENKLCQLKLTPTLKYQTVYHNFTAAEAAYNHVYFLGARQLILLFLLGIQTCLETVFTVNQPSFPLATPCPLHLVLVKTCIPSRYLIFKRCLERVLLSLLASITSQNSQKPLHQKIYKMMFWVYGKLVLGDTMII